jgi:hypothetical protein
MRIGLLLVGEAYLWFKPTKLGYNILSALGILIYMPTLCFLSDFLLGDPAMENNMTFKI